MTENEMISLRDLIEERLDAIQQLHEKDMEFFQQYIRTTDEARKIQAVEYERRLNSLNGEQARIAQSQATYISREIWEAFQKEHRTLMDRMVTIQSGSVSAKEFQVYKDSVEKALSLAAGQKQGVGMMTYIVAQVILTFVGVGTIVTAVLTFLRH